MASCILPGAQVDTKLRKQTSGRSLGMTARWLLSGVRKHWSGALASPLALFDAINRRHLPAQRPRQCTQLGGPAARHMLSLDLWSRVQTSENQDGRAKASN